LISPVRKCIVQTTKNAGKGAKVIPDGKKETKTWNTAEHSDSACISSYSGGRNY
jgi:hypothetical protein